MAVEGTAQPVADDLLVNAVRSGSVAAFEVLIERYDAPLRAFLFRLTGDAELAADLAQETFLDAFRCRQTLPIDRPFVAWLYRTARYNALPIRRRRTLHRIVSLDWLRSHRNGAIPRSRRLDEVQRADERDLIARALDQLSPNLREALVLSAIGGFSSQEVATIIGISSVAARKRISRATAEFRRTYQDQSDREAANDVM